MTDFYRSAPLDPSTFISSSQLCKSYFEIVKICFLKKNSLVEKFPNDSLACPFRYCDWHLCLYNRHAVRSNVSHCDKPHCTCSSSSSGQWSNRMDVGLWHSRDFSSSICDWHDGWGVWDSDVTTFVSIHSDSRWCSLVFDTDSFFFRRVLAMMIILGTIWFFVPKKL